MAQTECSKYDVGAMQRESLMKCHTRSVYIRRLEKHVTCDCCVVVDVDKLQYITVINFKGSSQIFFKDFYLLNRNRRVRSVL